MSVPMKELRFGANELTHVFLEHRANALGLDKCELARRIISAWAVREAHAHTMVTADLDSKRIKLDRSVLQSMTNGFDLEISQ